MMKFESIAEMSLERWNKTISTNLTSVFLVVREFLRQLSRDGISTSTLDKVAIVLVSSTAGKFGNAGHADYASAKSGEQKLTAASSEPATKVLAFIALMYGMLLSLKNEIVKIAPKGRVNCVGPGWVDTPMAKEALKNPDNAYLSLST